MRQAHQSSSMQHRCKKLTGEGYGGIGEGEQEESARDDFGEHRMSEMPQVKMGLLYMLGGYR